MIFYGSVGVRLLSKSRLLTFWSLCMVSAIGCSLLYDLDGAQCSETADCLARGAAFENTQCIDSICVSPTSTGGSDGSGGSSGSGANTSGGASGAPGCTTHMECVEREFGSPYLCRNGSCQSLTLAGECPVVLGLGVDNENLRKPDPIVFGAYSHVDPVAPRLSVPTLNYELAIDEVNENTAGGLPGGSGNTRRPFIAVVCSGTNSPDLDASLSHLIDDLEVPAILSSLYSKDLVEAFETRGHPNNVFFLSPLEADSTLTILPDDGLLWHMLTSGLDLAPAYLPLLARTEAYVREALELSEEDPIKVAMIDSRTPFLTDIANYLMANGEFNGQSFIDNENDGYFIRVRVDSAIEVANPDVTQAYTELESFRPHVVLAIASEEFVLVRNSLEATWPPGPPRPFYLASPYLFGIFGFADLAGSSAGRTLGVNFAGASDPTLYNLYLSRLKSTYSSSGLVFDGSENFYDAAYFLMYSIAGAGDPSRLTGREVALGMTRLITGSSELDVGPGDVEQIVGTLRAISNSTIALQGTMGPPTFNTSTGARRGLPSIYCLDGSSFQQDVMTYDPETETLEGEPPCVADF